MNWEDYWCELAKIDALKSTLEKDNPTKRWVPSSFPDIGCGDLIWISYTTDNQEGLLSLVDRCGEVTLINCGEEGQISSFTVKIYNNELVQVPYEDGSFTGHFTHLQRLE